MPPDAPLPGPVATWNDARDAYEAYCDALPTAPFWECLTAAEHEAWRRVVDHFLKQQENQ